MPLFDKDKIMMTNNKKNDTRVLERLFAADTPLVLYVGRAQGALSPTITSFPWNCIVTSRQNDRLAVDFIDESKHDLEELFTYQEVDSSVSLSRRYLKFVHLFGNDPTELARLKKNKAIEMLELIASRIRSGFGSFVITGYDPTDVEELPFERLADVLDKMRKSSVFMFGTPSQLYTDENFLAAVNNNQLVPFEESLEHYLDHLQALSAPESQDDDEVSFIEKRNLFFLNGKVTTIEDNELFPSQGFANLLTASVLGDVSVPPILQKEYFSKFLMESTSAPMWFGYENKFNVRRSFEDELDTRVDAALKSIKDRESQPLIVLAGQTGSSKSIALGQLAYRVYQEKVYPVIFIHDKNISFKYGSGNFNALEQLIHLLELKGARTVLLIWDNSAAYSDPTSEARQLLRSLRRRGRQCVLVNSAYMVYEGKRETARTDNVRVTLIQADISLIPKELQELRAKIIEFGSISPAQYDAWAKREDGDNLLVLLYRLFMDILGDSIAQGVRSEVSQTMQTILNPAKNDLLSNEPSFLNSLAVHMLKAGLPCSSEDKGESAHPNENSNIEELLHIVATASQFGVDLPLYFAVTVAGLQHWEDNFSSIIKHLHRVPFLRLPESPEVDGQSYGLFIGFRTQLEAKLYIEKSVSNADEMQLIVKLLDGLDNAHKSMEASALDRLVRTIGPNSPLYKQPGQADKIGKLKEYYPLIIDALSRMRIERKVLIPRLMCQEVTWLREIYGKDSSWLIDLRKEKLTEAIRIADSALNRVMPGRPTAEDQITRNNLIVERATSAWQIYRLGQAEDSSSGVSQLTFDYGTHRNALEEVIRNNPENGYPYNALLKLFLEMYRNPPSKEYSVNELSELLNLLDSFDHMMDEASSNEEFLTHKSTILGYISDSEVENHITKLIKEGKPTGLYLLGKRRLQLANINLDESVPLDKHPILSDLIEVFEKNKKIIESHSGCIYMLLRLKWQMYNQSPIFDGEKQLTRMDQAQWGELAKICRSHSLLSVGNIAHLLYIAALAEAQIGNYTESLRKQAELGKVLWLPSRSNYVWHILSDGDGKPKLFSGRVEQKYSVGLRDVKLQVVDVWEADNQTKRICRPIYARNLQALQINKPVGTYNDFEIGLNFKEFQAFRMRKKEA